MKARLSILMAFFLVLSVVVCGYALAQAGGKSDAVVHSVASDQASAGADEGGGMRDMDEVTAYKGKDEFREEGVIPAYPDVEEQEGMTQ